MKKYQALNSEIQVPIEWPLETASGVIISLVETAISIHNRTDWKVVFTIGDVSGMITQNETGHGYRFERTEEINHPDIYRIDLILPIKSVLVMPYPSGCGYEEDESKQIVDMNVMSDHVISQMIVSDPDRQSVMTAVPILEKFFERKGIRGPEKFNHTLQSTYQINKIKRFNNIVSQNESNQVKKAASSIYIEQVADEKWNIVFNDRLSPA